MGNVSWDYSVDVGAGTKVVGAYIIMAARRVVSKERQVLSI